MTGPLLDTQKARNIIEKLGWKMLSKEYSGYMQKIAVECPKGHIQKKTLNSIKKNSKCMKCHYKSGIAGKKTHTYEYVKEYIESFDYKLLSTEYKRQSDLLHMICNNGHDCHISFKKFKQNRRCRHCDPSKKKEYKEIKEFVESNGFQLLDKEYIPNNKLSIKCTNNHIMKKNWSSFYQRPVCGECSNPYKNMTREEYREMYQKSDKGIYSRYKNDCKRRSRKKRGIEMLLKFEEFSEIINKQCIYCGDISRGVDRVDSEKSYTVENSKPCCKRCNQMKNDLTKQEFIDHMKRVLVNLDEKL